MSRVAIADFLRRCIKYSDDSIERKRERGDSNEIIEQWQAYRDYTQYALDELEKGDLDHWLTRPTLAASMEIDMDELDHLERASWLSATLSPRPMALVSTRNGDVENVAPMTSLAVVSNSPPLVVMSLSQDREGNPRDTYRNLIESGECELQFLAATPEAAADTDLVSTKTSESEWDLIDADGPIHPLAVAVMHCRLLEDNALPDGAVARLLTLRVERMTVPSYLPPKEGFSLLCQHGLDRLTPSPIDWEHIATHHRS